MSRRTAPAAGGDPEVEGAPRWLVVVGALAALVGVVLRFTTTSPMWLDEALSVNIASLPLGDIPDALRRDGHPPLYYALLHGWMELLGSSDGAARALSGVVSVATLPLAWLVGRRLGGPRVAWLALIAFAASPFAVRYATEARMYALVMLLVLAGHLLVTSALERPRPLLLVGTTLVTGALLLTHYWGLWLVGAVGILLLVRAWRTTGDERRSTLLTTGAVAAGGLFLVPWLGVLLYQSENTGTPWGEQFRPSEVLGIAVRDLGGLPPNLETPLYGSLLAGLALLGLVGVASGRWSIELDLRTRPTVRREALVVVLTGVIALAAAYLASATFESRYAAVVVPLVTLMVAVGLRCFGHRAALAAAVAVLLVGAVPGLWRSVGFQRSQAEVLAERVVAKGDDDPVVVTCPDQLGPAVQRALPEGVEVTTYPRFGDPRFVDWVDYGERNAASDPAAFVEELLERAEGRVVYLAYAGQYRTLEQKCLDVLGELQAARGIEQVMSVQPDRYFEGMSLFRFAPR